MIFEKSWHLKWIDAAHSLAAGMDFSLMNHCVLYASGPDKNVSGFTVCEHRALHQEFFTKLWARMDKSELKDFSYTLLVPKFIEHRVQSLVNSKYSSRLKVKYTGFFELKAKNRSFEVRDRLRVVNVDDSPVLLKLFKNTFSEFGYFDVVAQVGDPQKAVDAIIRAKPDFVTMDIQMPGKTGVDVTRELLARESFPIIVVSSVSLEEGSLVFDALNEGAFDYVQKPRLQEIAQFKEELLGKCLSAVAGKSAHFDVARKARTKTTVVSRVDADYKKNLVWALGSSTGGTQALTQVFTSMPTKIPPTLIVQHMPPLFSQAFADSLNKLCPFEVCEAADGQEVLPNTVYIAPGGTQMAVVQRSAKMYIVISDDAPVNRFKPSVDFFFSRLAKMKNIEVVSAILTGMGRDGAQGLLDLKNAGAKTLAQDEKSCVVYGMPRAAFELGAVDELVSLENIAQVMVSKSLRQAKAA